MATFKDFENIPTLDAFMRADRFSQFTDFVDSNGGRGYWLPTSTVSAPEMYMTTPYHDEPQKYICFISHDYLGLSQHPNVKKAVAQDPDKSKTNTTLLKQLEAKMASFYRRGADESVIFAPEYSANRTVLTSLLKRFDVGICDMDVHSSVFGGLKNTNSRTFGHNDLSALHRLLEISKDRYVTKLVIVSGAYTQKGDTAPLREICHLVKKHDAYLMIDNTHSVGVLGKTGRGATEEAELLNEADIISGTFNTALKHIGGYAIANPTITKFIKTQVRQRMFHSMASTIRGILAAIDVMDNEPERLDKLWENILYFKQGLGDLGFDTGATHSAIIPVRMGSAYFAAETARLLLKKGILTNPVCSAIPKQACVRMTISAAHDKPHLDAALHAFRCVNERLKITENIYL